MEEVTTTYSYLDWLLRFVCDDYQRATYNDLMETLFYTEFVCLIERDNNRIQDGLGLRADYEDTFGDDYDVTYHLDGRCSVLELMIALSVRCEHFIMTDFKTDGTGFWFWTMISNLGLLDYTDDNFDEESIHEKLGIFMNRLYDRDGKGGLFWVPKTEKDMRKMEIWFQMNEYLISISDF